MIFTFSPLFPLSLITSRVISFEDDTRESLDEIIKFYLNSFPFRKKKKKKNALLIKA